LDEIDAGWSRLRSDDTGKCRHIDEVHPLIAFHLALARETKMTSGVPLNVYRRSLFHGRLRKRSLFHEKAARKDSAVHVSLSSDSLFKQPGDHGGPRPLVRQGAVEARASENHRMPCHCSSEELQRRAIAP